MKTLFLAATVAGAMLAGGAGAQTPPQQMERGGGMGMMRADTDGDGRISRAEAAAAADTRFARMDANGDGKLTPEEMGPRGGRGGSDMPPPPPPAVADAAAPPPARGMGGGRGIRRADADGNGSLTRDEFRALEMRRFDRLDANQDGFIDQGEMQAMRDRMMQMRERRGGGSISPPPPTQNPGQ
jgi:hypothetical protein